MKIYTKTGDKGYTSLIGGTRVRKNDLRIECYGTVDELNSYLGLLISKNIKTDDAAFLAAIQNDLFVIGSHLALEQEDTVFKLPDLETDALHKLEQRIDEMQAHLPKLQHFILPGGTESSSICHLARCVCRRAERLVVHLSENNKVTENIVIYLNRLSDFLFVLARKLCADENGKENIWISYK